MAPKTCSVWPGTVRRDMDVFSLLFVLDLTTEVQSFWGTLHTQFAPCTWSIKKSLWLTNWYYYIIPMHFFLITFTYSYSRYSTAVNKKWQNNYALNHTFSWCLMVGWSWIRIQSSGESHQVCTAGPDLSPHPSLLLCSNHEHPESDNEE